MRHMKLGGKNNMSVTIRDTESLNKYLNDISKIPMISADEEADLARKIKAGDMDALDRLTTANLRFVVSVAKRYQHQGLSLSDLINEGNIGLITAAKRFDETKGFKFISYAVRWIRQSIRKAITEQSKLMRLPLNQVDALHKINEASLELLQILEREPTNEEITNHLQKTQSNKGYTLKKVTITKQTATKKISLDAPIDTKSDFTLHSVVSNKADTYSIEKDLISSSLETDVQTSFSLLTPQQIHVITLYFGIGYKRSYSLQEIGEERGLTRERVRQIKDKALETLRESENLELLKKYLG